MGLLILTFFPLAGFAQERGDSRTLPVRLIDGHIVVALDLVSESTSLTVSLLVDLESSSTLTLQSGVLGGLRLGADEMSVSLSTVEGFKATVSKNELDIYSGQVDLDALTRSNSSTLSGRPLIGAIGVNFLRRYHVILDIQKQQLVLQAPGNAAAPSESVVVQLLDTSDGAVRVAVNRSGEPFGSMVLSSVYDTFIDATVATEIGAPAGNVMDVELVGSDGYFRLSDYVAFRPLDLPEGTRSVLVAGVSLLRNFRIEIDWQNRYVSFAQTLSPARPRGDFEFIEAELSDDSRDLIAFLEKYPQNFHVGEAASLLVKRRLLEAADVASLLEAARWYRDTSPPGQAGAYVLKLLLQFEAERPERHDLIIGTAELGLETVSTDMDEATRYSLHNHIGRAQLAARDIDSAWKHLLIAAFGMPGDALVNLNLGRVYEQQKRFRRAASRYQHALNLEGLSGIETDEAETALKRLESNR